MIRKPDARDFRESGTVGAIRDARTIAVEGAKGVRDGTAKFISRAFIGMMLFGFVMSMGIHIGSVALLLALAAGGAWFARRRTKPTALDAGWHDAPVATAEDDVAVEQVCVLSVGPCAQRAARIGVPAILFFPTAHYGWMAPFFLAGIAYVALAMLLIVRLFGDRTIVRYDDRGLTVVGLIGEAKILWADVSELAVRKASIFNLRVQFTSGSRRNLVVLGRVNRLGGPDTLYIPVDLLGIDRAAQHLLIERMLLQRDMARAGAMTGSAAPVRPVPRDYDRAAVTPRSPTPSVAPRILPHAVPDVSETAPFDADAIMARYMADRDRLRAAERPDLGPPSRPVFGRKTA